MFMDAAGRPRIFRPRFGEVLCTRAGGVRVHASGVFFATPLSPQSVLRCLLRPLECTRRSWGSQGLIIFPWARSSDAFSYPGLTMSILGVVAVGVNWDTMANETNGGGTPGDAMHVDKQGNSPSSPTPAAQAPIPTPPAAIFPPTPPPMIPLVFRTPLFRSFTPHEWTHLPDGWNPAWASYAEFSCVLGGLNYARLYAKPPGWTGPWNPPATKPPAPAAPPVVSGY